MVASQQEKQDLEKYLRKNLKYRETCAEFYDHILAALEAKPADGSFADAARQIINDDFGGIAGMRLIEAKYQQASFKELRDKYLQAILDCLKFPAVAVLLMYSIVVYYLVQQPWYSLVVFLGLMVAMRMIPGILKFARYVRSGYVFADSKRSARDIFYRWVDYIPGIVFVAVLCLTDAFNSTPLLIVKKPVFNMFFLILCGWHTVLFYKVYRKDLKTSFKIN